MNYQAVWDEAVEAGNKALHDCKPTPIGFYSAGIFGERLSETEVCEDGLCGGAYIVLLDSRGDFTKWCKENKNAQKNIMGRGYTISLNEAHKDYRGQSSERYTACADAFKAILAKNGIRAIVVSYLT